MERNNNKLRNSEISFLWFILTDHLRENVLMFYQILSTHPLRKYIEISLENLYVDIGT